MEAAPLAHQAAMPPMSTERPSIKVVVIGEHAVGKTVFLMRYVHGKCPGAPSTTSPPSSALPWPGDPMEQRVPIVSGRDILDSSIAFDIIHNLVWEPTSGRNRRLLEEVHRLTDFQRPTSPTPSTAPIATCPSASTPTRSGSGTRLGAPTIACAPSSSSHSPSSLQAASPWLLRH